MEIPSAAPSTTHKRRDGHTSRLSHPASRIPALPSTHLWGGDTSTLPSSKHPNSSPSLEEPFPESQGGGAMGQLQLFQSTLNICTGEERVARQTQRGWVHRGV